MIPAGIIPRFARTQFRLFHSHTEFHILTSHYPCLPIYNDSYLTSFQIVNFKSPGKTHSIRVHHYHHNNLKLCLCKFTTDQLQVVYSKINSYFLTLRLTLVASFLTVRINATLSISNFTF